VMRILYVAFMGCLGGCEEYLLDLASGMSRPKHDVRILLLVGHHTIGCDAFARRLAESGLACDVLDSQWGRRSLYKAVAQRAEQMAAHRPDLIHFSQAIPGMCRREMMAARWLGVPVVSTLHAPMTTAPERACALVRILLPHLADYYIVVSKTNKRLAHEAVGVPLERISVVHLGIDVAAFSVERDSTALAARGIGPDDFVVGTVGRLDFPKAHHVLIDAARMLCDRGLPDTVRFVIVGGGPREAELKSMAAAFGRRVVFTGAMPREEIPRALARFDLFAMSSDIEGQPYGLLEAMAAGLPVVATAVGGIPDVITDGENGLLVPKGDAAALAGKLRLAIEDAQLRRALGEQARRTIDDRYSLDRMLTDTEAIYRRALDRPPRRRFVHVRKAALRCLCGAWEAVRPLARRTERHTAGQSAAACAREEVE